MKTTLIAAIAASMLFSSASIAESGEQPQEILMPELPLENVISAATLKKYNLYELSDHQKNGIKSAILINYVQGYKKGIKEITEGGSATILSNARMDMPVRVSLSGVDRLGKQLSYKLKDKIEKSSSLHTSYDDEMLIEVSLVTLDVDDDDPGRYTTYSASWLWSNPQLAYPFYLTTIVGTCGSNRIESCADNLVAETHSQAEKIFKTLKN